MPGPLHEVDTPFKKATFGMGCFWSADALYGGTPGVLRTRVGYSGGTKENPTYPDIGDHTEVIEIDYDPKLINYEELLRLFWDNHEYGLTTIIKRQYMSLILYHEEDQKRIAEISLKKESHKRNQKLITVIAPAGPFYDAEAYHQKYRLQQYEWLCKALDLSGDLLKSSHVAAKLNGYVAGIGTTENLHKDLNRLGLSKNINDFIIQRHAANLGGNLFC